MDHQVDIGGCARWGGDCTLTTPLDMSMVSNMKTTIDIPDSLMQRCKRVAAEQRVTFRGLVEEGLNRVLDERATRKPFRLRKVKFGGGGFQPGFEEGDWERIRNAAYEGRGS
jgi:hypothetical protein